MEQEHSEAEVPGGIVEGQLTPGKIQYKSIIMKKLHWVSGRFGTNFVPAEEISDLVKELVENDQVITAMLNEPGGKLIGDPMCNSIPKSGCLGEPAWINEYGRNSVRGHHAISRYTS